MADKTHIEWTDATWNPITGCSIVSKGCTHCYAMQLAGTRLKDHGSRAGLTQRVNGNHVWTGEVRFNEKWLAQPLKWSKPRRIFVCAHGDLFHENVPDEWIDRVFAIMALAPQHTFQVLTKRAARMRDYLSKADRAKCISSVQSQVYTSEKMRKRDRAGLIKMAWSTWPLPNVWLGVSIEDQATANERIPQLLSSPAALHWYSGEPLLGEINLLELAWPADWPRCDCEDHNPTLNAFTGSVYCAGCCEGAESMTLGRLGWGVVGGESGGKSRPMRPDWARSLRDQHEGEEVPWFFKQWGQWAPQLGAIEIFEAGERSRYRWAEWQEGRCDGSLQQLADGWEFFDRPMYFEHDDMDDTQTMICVGKKAAGSLLDGTQHHNWPKVQS